MKYSQYWGKAKKADDYWNSHPLFLHSLDVAAVAHEWWKNSLALQRSFIEETQLPEKQIQAWIQFFIALHDLGKLDIRFQNKVPELAPYSDDIKNKMTSDNYYHDEGGYRWFVQESNSVFENCASSQKRNLQNWLAHTAGHHGKIPKNAQPHPLPSYVSKEAKQDQLARKAFIEDIAKLFLKPQSISFENISLPENPPVLLAGFCSVCDWLGSNTDYFPYEKSSENIDILTYFESKKEKAKEILKKLGLLREVIISQGGMNQIYPHLKSKNIQTIISNLDCNKPSLTIIEASTGSGKTEAAIAFASHLLVRGLADSITFALPTQATANAILNRLKVVAEKIFSFGPNVILAHGKSPYNENFKTLIKNSSQQTKAKGNEAGVQCHEWLSLSRRRAFLGQIAVTTIDQVLLSAIESLKHFFVRSFGIGKSVLIIDEIHAYDAYMYGLLKKVIESQKKAGGSVILLSATLPFYQKEQLLTAWNADCSKDNDYKNKYPLILQATSNQNSQTKESNLKGFFLKREEEHKKVSFELWSNNDMILDQSKLKKIAEAAKYKKAKIGIICNLVDDAQRIAEQLKELKVAVDILHSRYRYKDRMEKEKYLIERYGKNSTEKGCVLVGTQILEQSLDIDFDWLITFLSPIDLLFQRMGRLHRHFKERPKDFEFPHCSIVLPEKGRMEYKSHEYVYKSKRVLWRTQQMLYKQNTNLIIFPKAYRKWIEQVYQENTWKNEPEEITNAFEKYQSESQNSILRAYELAVANTHFSDTDENAAILTREGKMNLSVIPVIEKDTDQYFLESEKCIDRSQYENLSQNVIPVSASWKHFIAKQPEKNIYYLPMQKETQDKKYLSKEHHGYKLCYTREYGLKKVKC